MMPVLLFVTILLIGILLPHLPGRYDASAATLSSVIQVASYASPLLVPVSLAWIVSPRRVRLWQGLTWVVAGLVVLVIAVSAVAVNQLAMGVILGIGAFTLLRLLRRRTQAYMERMGGVRHRLAVYLTVVPVLLVTFVTTVPPRAARVRGPGVPAGQMVEQLVGNVDLAPTWAELGGAKVPDFVDGRSLVPLWGANPQQGWRQAYLLMYGNPATSAR